MEIIDNTRLEPYFNLASEEYFLNREGDFFILWRNAKSVIIGKNQNAFAEIEPVFVKEHAIKVVRRLTGGGAVFHDEGNINFTFITDADGDGLDFGRFIAPITKALSGFGVFAAPDGRNDIIADGGKISGNAECVYDTKDGRKRLMHHGTLLFSADMSGIAGALRPNPEKLKSKGIKSVSSRVKNIKDIEGYCGPDTAEGFKSALLSFAQKEYSAAARCLTDSEISDIQKLCDEKYSLWEWNYGASPTHTTEYTKRFPYGTLTVSYSAVHGEITEISVTGDFFGERDISELCDRLKYSRLVEDELQESLAEVSSYISGATPHDVARLILGE